MPFIVEQDEPGHPIDVGALRPFRVVQQAHLRTHLIEQLRQLNRLLWRIHLIFLCNCAALRLEYYYREERRNLFRSGDMLFRISKNEKPSWMELIPSNHC